MQTISLHKFGNILVSRPDGLEAFKAIRPTLSPDEPVEIDFGDVLTVTPSWFDEFLTNLAEYIHSDITLLPTKNASVRIALPEIIHERDDRVTTIVQKAIDTMEL